jgi:hypothetical protein
MREIRYLILQVVASAITGLTIENALPPPTPYLGHSLWIIHAVRIRFTVHSLQGARLRIPAPLPHELVFEASGFGISSGFGASSKSNIDLLHPYALVNRQPKIIMSCSAILSNGRANWILSLSGAVGLNCQTDPISRTMRQFSFQINSWGRTEVFKTDHVAFPPRTPSDS